MRPIADPPPRGPAGRRRRARLGSLAAASALVLGACGSFGSTDTLPSDEVVGHYDAVAEDLIAAMDTVRPLAWEHGSQGVIEPGAADCRYRAGAWQADEPLYPEPGQGMDWDPWREALDPVLQEHGFGELGREKSSGAVLEVESTDDHGARLVLESTGAFRITDIPVDAEPCVDATLGL